MPKRLSPLRLFFRLLAAGGALAMLGVALLAAWIAILAGATPAPGEIRQLKVDRPSVLMSSDGEILARFQRINRQWVGLDQVAQPVIDALIATEDRRFYSHRGIDLRRSLIAAAKSLGGERQGGSTLTQQLARNLFPREVGRAPTLTRKIKEAITAWRLEHAYSKREILEIYLNTAHFLYNVSGIEMAARTYFDTGADQLTAAQAATLVAMLKGSAAYNPVRNPERALARRNLVLAQMVEQGRLGRAEFEALRGRPLELRFAPPQAPGAAPHFAEQVRRVLAPWAAREGLDLDADGLVIETTLDTRLQALAEQAVERQIAALQQVADVEWARPGAGRLSTRIEAYAGAHPKMPAFAHFWNSQPRLLDSFVRESPEFAARVAAGEGPAAADAALRADADFMARLKADKTRLEAGFVVLDRDSGEVRAWVGSRDYAVDNYDHVAQARRQPGSTFKAFVYAAALEAGMPADRPFVDAPIAIRLSDGRVWQPGDMGGSSGALMRMEDGLIYSRNSITTQVVAEIGAPRVADLARHAGVRESPLDPVPSLALGTSPVSLLEMAAGYATIARGGRYLPPSLVRRVLDRDGRELLRLRPNAEPALSPDTAGQLLEMLRSAVDRGTGRGLRQRLGPGVDLAGKTGTSQHNADGWFILMHPQVVAGAWVGFNDQRVRMRSDYWGQGAHTALYVAGDFLREALAAGAVDGSARFPRWLPPPRPPLIVTDTAPPEAEPEPILEIVPAPGHVEPAAPVALPEPPEEESGTAVPPPGVELRAEPPATSPLPPATVVIPPGLEIRDDQPLPAPVVRQHGAVARPAEVRGVGEAPEVPAPAAEDLLNPPPPAGEQP